MDKLIQKIKGKKNLGISDKYVIKLLEKYLQKKDIKELFNKDYKEIIKNKKFKQLTKKIRKELYSVYGVFQVKRQWRKEELLNEIRKSTSLNEIKNISKEILKLHSSSRERLNEYNKIYKNIFKITGRPEIIIDLACGLNAFSLILINFKGKYIGYEISKTDVDLLNKYYKIIKRYGIDCKVYLKDIKDNLYFEKGGICLLLKFIDSVKNKNQYFIDLLNNLKCEYLIVSFSKKTISLKNMKKIERKWFIKLLEKMNLKYKKFETENETFYVIKLKLS